MTRDAAPSAQWTPVSPGRLHGVRALATVVFVVLSVFAFAQFYSGLETRAELTDLATTGAGSQVYWVFGGLWIPLSTLLAGLTTIAVWTVAQHGHVHLAGWRRLQWAGLACAGFCLLGVVGVAVTAPSPFLAAAWSALVALALTLIACGVQALGAQLLAPPTVHRPAGSALR